MIPISIPGKVLKTSSPKAEVWPCELDLTTLRTPLLVPAANSTQIK